MSSLNYHKVRRNLFIIKGGIEVGKLFFGAILDMRNDNLAISLKIVSGHQRNLNDMWAMCQGGVGDGRRGIYRSRYSHSPFPHFGLESPSPYPSPPTPSLLDLLSTFYANFINDHFLMSKIAQKNKLAASIPLLIMNIYL